MIRLCAIFIVVTLAAAFFLAWTLEKVVIR